MPSTETGRPLSSPEDPFEHDTLFSLMPNLFKGLISQNPSDPLNAEQDLHQILSQLALKKTAKDTEQANAILNSIPNLDTAGINVDMALFCKRKIEQPEYMEEMAQQPALYKENIPPNKNFPIPRIRREGTGRVSSTRPFTINSSSFGSNLNVQKDLRTLPDVDEFFAAIERQETAEAILRKMRGENSPVACSQQSLKTRVRRQGSGRTTISKKFDFELLGNTEKYMQIDREKLEVEEEDPISTFRSEAEQACEMPIETEDRKTNKVLSFQESRHEDCLSETLNGELRYQKNVGLNSNWQNCIQANDQHSMAHGGDMDGLQLNPVREKEKLCGSEIEETVNMPPKNSFDFEYSPDNALQKLFKDYLQHDADKTNSAPFSRSRLEINDVAKSYPKDLDCDTQYALQQSQTESSNTIHSQSLFTDEVKTIMQPYQFPKNFHLEGFDRTPRENFCQKPTETSSPLTSPTPPSKLSAAFKLRRKHKIVTEGKSGDACKPPIENRDEEAAKVHTSSPSHVSRRLHTSSATPIFRRLHTSSPSCISRKLCSSNPLKKGESSGVRRLSFDSSSRSPKQDEFNSGESLNDAKAMDLVIPSNFNEENDRVEMVTTNSSSRSPKQDEFNIRESVNDAKATDLVIPSNVNVENDRVEMAKTDVDLSNVTVLSPQKSTSVNNTEPPNLTVLVSDQTEKDVLGCASGEQIEESPVTLHKKNAKKAKRQSKNNANSSGCDAHEEDKIISNEIETRKRKNKKYYQHRQSLAGAGTLWKSGVRRSTRIRSRPLEYWRGERFLYGRIHNSLTTVIGIKYSSPLNAQQKKQDHPNFKVQSYVEDQYSHMVEFAALY